MMRFLLHELAAKVRTGNGDQKTDRAWIELDFESLRHNVWVLRNVLPQNCRLMPAVKANAYGHGAPEICRELNRLGVHDFCVATVAEGVELRKQRIRGNILVLGYTPPGQFCLLRRHRLMQSVFDYEYAEALDAYGKKITVHIRVDTGMKHLGISSDDTDSILRMFHLRNLEIAGIYTHFSMLNADNHAHNACTQAQMERFERVIATIRECGYPLPKIHMQGSYGAFHRTELSCDYARPGSALYGVFQHNNTATACETQSPPRDFAGETQSPPRDFAGETQSPPLSLRPVLSVKAKVAAVKTIREGEAVGYGNAFVADRRMRLAVLSIGYADGIPRSLSCGAGHVLINGSAAPVVGYICMDQMTVDVTGLENVKQGDVAVIVGRDGDAEITATDVASLRARFDPGAMAAAQIYPTGWTGEAAEFNGLAAHLAELRRFYRVAAENGEAVLLAIT